ncbi:MAG: hypothetical protein DNFNHJIP_00030 [Candidatus Argoarchaeum ethanivorans]|uniref:Uncharacterized protein n=1 Tax=Candidatus Argoarchaeum ethanivorans TaxID=2608793 RepID=A0A812A0T2_9EURY|nr:MAG: hypothetical protein DNFNHJIP_00030 [Candidatus Argoarchaeum ethanivorans]
MRIPVLDKGGLVVQQAVGIIEIDAVFLSKLMVQPGSRQIIGLAETPSSGAEVIIPGGIFSNTEGVF